MSKLFQGARLQDYEEYIIERLSDWANTTVRKTPNFLSEKQIELLNGRLDEWTVEFAAEIGWPNYRIDAGELHKMSLEEIGGKMPMFVDGDVAYSGWPEYWDNLKDEFKILTCTEDEKYADLRKKFSESGNKSHVFIVSMLAVAFSSHLGIAAGVLVPFCAVCVVAILKMGHKAFCKTWKLDVPLARTKPAQRLPQVDVALTSRKPARKRSPLKQPDLPLIDEEKE